MKKGDKYIVILMCEKATLNICTGSNGNNYTSKIIDELTDPNYDKCIDGCGCIHSPWYYTCTHRDVFKTTHGRKVLIEKI